MLLIAAMIGIVAAMAVPGLLNGVDRLRLGMATRDVQSELQSARLKAVSANTLMRVRFDCPAAGQFRMVERIGAPFADTIPADDTDANAAQRCSLTNYPIKRGATGRVTKPNNDGPIRTLQQGVTFSAQQVIEFWPDGSVHVSSATNPWPQVAAAGAAITLAKGSTTKTITVTGLGNIQMQR